MKGKEKVKIKNIDLRKGEFLFIKFNGDVEHSIAVSWEPEDQFPVIKCASLINCETKQCTVPLIDEGDIMRKSNAFGGIIDKLEFYETELNCEIKRMKDANLISMDIFSSISNALDRTALALQSMKRIL